jgi:hypothetical protein
MSDPTVEREMRELHAILDAMETTQRHIVDVGDISKAESENEVGNEGCRRSCSRCKDVAEELTYSGLLQG